jgi:hypothetical protein
MATALGRTLSSSPANRVETILALRFIENPFDKMGHEDAVYLAKLAEQAERYEGMCLSQGSRASISKTIGWMTS